MGLNGKLVGFEIVREKLHTIKYPLINEVLNKLVLISLFLNDFQVCRKDLFWVNFGNGTARDQPSQ